MKNLVSGFLVSLALVGLAATLTPAWGQEVTAAIMGTVTDPSGAPIKGATVVANGHRARTVWTAQTNDTGSFNILRLPDRDLYGAEATAAWFRKDRVPSVHTCSQSDGVVSTSR